MKHQIATNPEQSQRLIACGVNPHSADMCYLYWDESGDQLSRDEYLEIFNDSFLDGRVELVPKDFADYDHSYETDSPAWSLSALLALLPKEITDDNGNEYHFSLAYERPLCSDYDVSYKPCWFDGEDLIAKHDSSPIEACVQMIEWLTANGYTLNTK